MQPTILAPEPRWLEIARGYLGVAEIPGKGDNPTIQRWLRGLRAWWDDDDTPWCGTFVAQCLEEAGLDDASPKDWYRARAYATVGLPLLRARYGCIVVFERKGGGHVGFNVGRYADGRLAVLGGNQGNRVSIAPFGPARVLAYRWPEAQLPPWRSPPLLASTGTPSSSNEA